MDVIDAEVVEVHMKVRLPRAEVEEHIIGFRQGTKTLRECAGLTCMDAFDDCGAEMDPEVALVRLRFQGPRQTAVARSRR
jgi:hypothetical protein